MLLVNKLFDFGNIKCSLKFMFLFCELNIFSEKLHCKRDYRQEPNDQKEHHRKYPDDVVIRHRNETISIEIGNNLDSKASIGCIFQEASFLSDFAIITIIEKILRNGKWYSKCTKVEEKSDLRLDFSPSHQ